MNQDCLKISTASALYEVIGCNDKQVNGILGNKSAFYTTFPILKKDGTQRDITPPKSQLKKIQRGIKNYIEKRVRWRKIIHGGVKKRNILSNAGPHIGKTMVANLDISKFFPSTGTEMIKETLRRCGLVGEVNTIIAELVTYNNSLPQGSPTSMILGNLVLEALDEDFLNICDRHDLAYTRYVDDLTISGMRRLEDFRSEFLRIVSKHGFKVSESKIKFQGQHQPQEVTGLMVNSRLSPTNKFISNLNRIIRDCWTKNEGIEVVAAREYKTTDELKSMIYGRMRFVRNIDKKKGDSIRSLIAGISWTPHEPSDQYFMDTELEALSF